MPINANDAALTQSQMSAPTPPASISAPWSTVAPKVTIGSIERLDNLPSRHIDVRPIDVWLPPDYSRAQRYAVLYMHDGQNLFDPVQTWNKTAWNVHEALSKLMRVGVVQNTIVVGIPSHETHRYSEYFPEKFLALLPPAERDHYVRCAQWGKPLADAYLRFVVQELKPAIDARYATVMGPEGTFTMGSSMGGLISIYALCEYPQVFGGAAGLSTHWIGKPSNWGTPEQIQNASLPLAAFTYLHRQLPKPGTHRIYTDQGTTGLDAVYTPHHAYANLMAAQRGYTAADWQSQVAVGTGHTELDWAARVDVPLKFLLAPR